MRRLVSAAATVLAVYGLVACGGSAAQRHSTTAAHARTSSRAHRGGRVQTVRIRSGHRRRSYLLYVPPNDAARHPLPLVLVFHGADSNARNAVVQTGLLTSDERTHFAILAFLQGVDNTWNDDAGEPPAERAHVNDIGFARAVLQHVEAHHAVNMRRVVATGLSNGAILVELLGCRMARLLTLIVPVEGQMGARFAGNCHPGSPVSVYEVHATGDQAIPYNGGTFIGVGGPVHVLSAPATVSEWARLDGCAQSAHNKQQGGSIITVFGSCQGNVSVTLNTIQGGSHRWPPGFSGLLASVIARQSSTRSAATPAR